MIEGSIKSGVRYQVEMPRRAGVYLVNQLKAAVTARLPLILLTPTYVNTVTIATNPTKSKPVTLHRYFGDLLSLVKLNMRIQAHSATIDAAERLPSS